MTRPIWKTSRNDTFINKPVQYDVSYIGQFENMW
jgi:hypothetical protein